MRSLLYTSLLLLPGICPANASAPSTVPPCELVIFETKESWIISCPSGTPWKVVESMSEAIRDEESDQVTLLITPGKTFERPICSRWVLFRLSQNGLTTSPSWNVDWTMLSKLTAAIEALGYGTDFRLANTLDLVSINDDDWTWRTDD
ncbi:MAG: hypothetical protein AAGD07_19890 [Planctomycetota bacterium]